jgi:hypothetical protein
MSYTTDKNGEIVIKGFQDGIADDPYAGISDIRNMNLISIPKEASVNFSTSKISYPTITGSISSVDTGNDTVTVNTGTFENGMSIIFSGGSLPTGITAGTIYWVGNVASGVTFKLYTDQILSTLVDITASGTGTYSTLNPTKLLNWAYDNNLGYYYAVDSTGYVWGTNRTTPSGYWTFTGNTTVTNASGQGLVYYSTNNNTGYLFVFRNSRIDYALSGSTMSWTYGWTPSSGGSGGSALNTGNGYTGSHKAIVGQDNGFYWCDGSYIGSILGIAGSTFDPTSTSTYTYAQKALAIPFIDTAQCLAELGTNLLVGGSKNQIYPWDRISTSFAYPILIAENNVKEMVTVNTNTFIFVGNRGRIWITNGTQAQLFKKVPDHLSETVEPYFTWGGACSIKNQLYFGVQATTNSGTANNNYGGVWAIDLDTKAIRLTNQLSYGTYAGVASIVFPIFSTSPAGTGLYIGWDNGLSGYGIDITSSSPYTTYKAYIDTDNIPIGTLRTPKTPSNIEFKLATPLVSGEGVKISYRLDFSKSFSEVFETTTVGAFSGVSSVNFQNAQWLQLRVETKSTASSPSYVRLTEIRIRQS